MIDNSSYTMIVEREQYKNKNILYQLVFFIVWPFGSFLYALWNYNKKESLLVFVLFTGLFSFSMQSNSEMYDLDRVLNSAELYASKPDSEFFEIVTGLYGNEDDAGVDIYRDLVSFVVTRFTSNGHVLLMIFGLVYGFLFSKSISTLLKINDVRNIKTALILVSFSMIFSMDQIAGIRFATAAYLFFFGLINYLWTSEKKYFVILSLSCLVHFSFLSLIVLLLLYLIIKPTEKITFIALIGSFLAGTLFKGAMVKIFELLGGSIEKRANLYLGVEGVNQHIVWFVAYREELMLAFIALFFIVSKLSKTKLVETKLTSNLYNFSMFVLILSNLSIAIPDASYRFMLVFIFLFMAYVYLSYKQNFNHQNLNYLYSYASLFFVLQIFYAGRNILYYSPLMLFYGSTPLFAFKSENELLTWNFIMQLF